MIRRVSGIEAIIFVAGLLLAVVAGIAGYHVVGLYGDGAFALGFHREIDPASGRSVLVHVAKMRVGTVRRVIDDDLRVKETDIDADGDGRYEKRLTFQLKGDEVQGIGFSLRNDGVIDAWAYRDASGNLDRIEVSSKRDGKIDRWERYVNGQMIRVDFDTNGNGRIDRWQTYQDGILMDTFVDANEDGKADGPPIR
jgi:hypothetical protein